MKGLVLVLFVLFSFCHISVSADDLNKDNTIQQESSFEDEMFSDFESEYKEADAVYDPLSGYNRMMTSFNDMFYMNVLHPVSKTYAKIVYEDIRIGIDNVFRNLFFPIRFINNVLQGKGENAGDELGRFMVNSTVGLFGIFDVAKHYGVEAHPEDFGQTLGFYGVGSGPHVVLPLLGPSNVRDIFGLSADLFVNPTSSFVVEKAYKIPDNAIESLGVAVVYSVNTTSLELDRYPKLREMAVDLYPFLRDFYEQDRKNKIEK